MASLFPKLSYNILSPNFHIHVSVSDLYITWISLLVSLQLNRQQNYEHRIHWRSLISLRKTIILILESHPRTFALRWGGAGGGSGQPRQGALSALRGQDRPAGGGGGVQTKLPLFFLTKRIIFSRFLSRSAKVKKYCMTLHPVLSILQIYLRKWDFVANFLFIFLWK